MLEKYFKQKNKISKFEDTVIYKLKLNSRFRKLIINFWSNME